jgi:hypothetical protein
MFRQVISLFTIGYGLFLLFPSEVHAMGLEAETSTQRIGAILLGALVFIMFMLHCHRRFTKSFFNGFIVSTGLFFSFDIVVFHWVFNLHRITSGSEADILEPILVLIGIIFLVLGLRNESHDVRKDEGNERKCNL